jgi:hypothetical protein
MDLKTALITFGENVHGRIPTGYWEQDGQIIFNTKTASAIGNLAAPAQYVVTKDGKVYGTNPLQFNLDPAKLKKLPTLR